MLVDPSHKDLYLSVANEQSAFLQILTAEYSALKAESTARIGHRDTLLYTTLGAVGAVFAFVTVNKDSRIALLVVPWVTFILGWQYLVNDHLVSRLGKYVRVELTRQVYNSFAFYRKKYGDGYLREAFRWEPFHRSDQLRIERKWIQLVVDWATFVAPTFVAIGAYLYPGFPGLGGRELSIWVLIVASISAAGFLAYQIWIYADTYSSEVQRLADLAQLWTEDEGVTP